MNEGSPLFPLMVIVATVGALPFFAVAVTSFTKISIVLLILRNALGIQQTPPNIIIYAIAIILSVNIMSPVFGAMFKVLASQNIVVSDLKALGLVAETALNPLRDFLLQHTLESSRAIFQPRGAVIANAPVSSDITVVVPAFLLDELTKAFEIGIRLYVPFIVIDFVVSAILIAMGMQMLSPPLISTPLKVLLFVLVDGWARLFQGLILTYNVGP